MTDNRTPEQRRRIMQSVKTKDTGPEKAVRRALFAKGYRFRKHRRDLPGSPDIVFPSYKKVIFVHGCFWHCHTCKRGKTSKSHVEYWGPKLNANRARDKRNIRMLRALGWGVMVVWQCELADTAKLLKRMTRFMERQRNPPR